MPTYRPELDLVVSTPDGELAGFCVGWFEPSRRIAPIEPLGVHPRFHQLGLGRVLLLEVLRRFKEHGATSAMVETDGDRILARHTYESVGFQLVHIMRSTMKLAESGSMVQRILSPNVRCHKHVKLQSVKYAFWLKELLLPKQQIGRYSSQSL